MLVISLALLILLASSFRAHYNHSVGPGSLCPWPGRAQRVAMVGL
jgi:hypothetical protein